MMFAYNMDAGMAELADAHGSGPCGSNTMRVQVSFPARKSPVNTGLFVYRGNYFNFYDIRLLK